MLPRVSRLKKDEEIKKLFERGKAVHDDWCSIKLVKNGLPRSRFAVVVGTKASKNAVDRNRLKRQLRAILEKHRLEIHSGFDLAVIGRSVAIGKSSKEIEAHFLRGLERSGLWKP